jgi:Myb DNA-binding like
MPRAKPGDRNVLMKKKEESSSEKEESNEKRNQASLKMISDPQSHQFEIESVTTIQDQSSPPKPATKKAKTTKVPLARNLVPASLAHLCSTYSAPKPLIDPSSLKKNAYPPPLANDFEDDPFKTSKGPQVKIVDGEIVLQESSLIVVNDRKTVEEVEEEFHDVVEEEGHTTIVGASYNSFTNHAKRAQHWSLDETKLFFSALRQVGADFVTMEAYFPHRSRKQIKKKYQAELARNANLITLALNPRNRLPIDLSIFDVDKDSIVVTKHHAVTPHNVNSKSSRSTSHGNITTTESTSTITKHDSQDATTTSSSNSTTPTETDTLSSTSSKTTKSHALSQDVDDNAHKTTIMDDMQQSEVSPMENEVDLMEGFPWKQEDSTDKVKHLVDTVIPLAPITSQSKSKRPKFRAGQQHRKGK